MHSNTGCGNAKYSMSSNDEQLINPIPPRYLDLLDPQYIALYNEYHGMRKDALIFRLANSPTHSACKLRADQVNIAQVRANPRHYGSGIGSMTGINVGKVEYHDIAVRSPDGSIKVAVYTPTAAAAAKNQMRDKHGLPGHVNFHGGKFHLQLMKSIS